MKVKLMIKSYFCVATLVLVFSCKKQLDPCEKIDMEFLISSETNAWLLDDYFDTDSEIIFVNNSGIEKIFKHSETNSTMNENIVSIDCGDDVQRVNLIYERISRFFESDDSIKIILSTTLETDRCQWGGKDNTRMFEQFKFNVSNEKNQYYNYDNDWGQLGFLKVITQPNDSYEFSISCGDSYTFYSNKTIANSEYYNVYGQDTTIFNRTTDVFYSESDGIIGFIDKDNTEWKIAN